jgi:hypothetical protein
MHKAYWIVHRIPHPCIIFLHAFRGIIMSVLTIALQAARESAGRRRRRRNLFSAVTGEARQGGYGFTPSLSGTRCGLTDLAALF